MQANNTMKRALLTVIVCFALVSPAQAFTVWMGDTIGRTWMVPGPGGNYGFVEFIAGSRSGTWIYYGGHCCAFVRQPIELVAGCAATVPLVIASLLMFFIFRRRKGPR